MLPKLRVPFHSEREPSPGQPLRMGAVCCFLLAWCCKYICETIMFSFVIALPVITADYTQTLIQGTPKNVICSVKSRPASIIRWTADSGVVGKESQSMIMSGHYFITTAIFHINYPLYVMDGKNIKCTVVPVIGSVVDRTMSLKVLSKLLFYFLISFTRYHCEVKPG